VTVPAAGLDVMEVLASGSPAEVGMIKGRVKVEEGVDGWVGMWFSEMMGVGREGEREGGGKKGILKWAELSLVISDRVKGSARILRPRPLSRENLRPEIPSKEDEDVP